MKRVIFLLISIITIIIGCTKDKPITFKNEPQLYSFSAYLGDNMKYCANQFVAFDIKDSSLIKSLKESQFLNDSQIWIMSVPFDSSNFINRNFDFYEKQDTFLITGKLFPENEGFGFCLALLDVPPRLFFITKIQKK